MSIEGFSIVNLTQHPASPDQRAAGVRDFYGEDLETLRHILTYQDVPDQEELRLDAEFLANMATEFEVAMIGGAPYLMAPLERALRAIHIVPVYAFSRRESVEEEGPDGAVVKRAVFRHLGFVEAGE